MRNFKICLSIYYQNDQVKDGMVRAFSMHTGFWYENHKKDTDLDRMILLKLIIKNRIGSCGLVLSDTGQIPEACFCEHSNIFGFHKMLGVS
jgi:hypothetical protein